MVPPMSPAKKTVEASEAEARAEAGRTARRGREAEDLEVEPKRTALKTKAPAQTAAEAFVRGLEPSVEAVRLRDGATLDLKGASGSVPSRRRASGGRDGSREGRSDRGKSRTERGWRR